MKTDELQRGRDVFRMPVLIGVASTLGLASALVGDGPWDLLSWLALALPVAAVVRAWRRRE